MDMQELVRTVVREVMSRLDNGTDMPCVKVFGTRDESVCQRVRECMGTECVVKFHGEDMAGLNPSHHVLPILSCSDMADLAMGKASGVMMSEVLELVLSGNEVHVLEFGYRSHAETAPVTLLGLYEDYEKRLASFGVKEWKPKGPDSLRFRGTLLTEKDVVELCRHGATRVLVGPGTIVTPLAVDAAQTFNCSIEKQQ